MSGWGIFSSTGEYFRNKLKLSLIDSDLLGAVVVGGGGVQSILNKIQWSFGYLKAIVHYLYVDESRVSSKNENKK